MSKLKSVGEHLRGALDGKKRTPEEELEYRFDRVLGRFQALEELVKSQSKALNQLRTTLYVIGIALALLIVAYGG